MKNLAAFAKQYGPVVILIAAVSKGVWLLSGISSKVDTAVESISLIQKSILTIGEDMQSFKDTTKDEINGLKQRTSILEERSSNRDRKREVMLADPN